MVWPGQPGELRRLGCPGPRFRPFLTYCFPSRLLMRYRFNVLFSLTPDVVKVPGSEFQSIRRVDIPRYVIQNSRL